MSRHTCSYFSAPHRNQRHCKHCGARQWLVNGTWRRSMTLEQFASKWLPATSGTGFKDMLTVKVAFPFEYNCYESWNVAFRVWFQLPDVTAKTEAGLGTRIDCMNGWMSKYAQDFCQIDAEAEAYYTQRTGRVYEIGDNTYGAMRDVIQS